MIELILGGARSGKSRHAEQQALASGLPVTCIVTAEALDAEMAERIANHQRQRPAGWQLVEEPRQLAAVLQQQAAAQRCLLVDCLTLWLSNLLDDPAQWQQQRQALLQVLPQLPGRILLVSNETGLGVVPMGQLTREFVDQAGWLHQQLAQISQRVTFCVAGLPMILKDSHD